MLNISICEDDENMLELLKRQVSHFLTDQGIAYTIAAFHDPTSFWANAQEAPLQSDAFIIDWEMPVLSGRELVRLIKGRYLNPYIILLTCHTEYVYDGYELEVFRFITKEDYEDRLYSALLEIQTRLKQRSDKYYIYSARAKKIKIYYSDILYLTKNGKNTIIQTKSWGALSLRTSMNILYRELNSEVFLYVDRCYIVNIDHIKAVQSTEPVGIVLSDHTSLSVSKSKIQDIMEALNAKWSGEM